MSKQFIKFGTFIKMDQGLLQSDIHLGRSQRKQIRDRNYLKRNGNTNITIKSQTIDTLIVYDMRRNKNMIYRKRTNLLNRQYDLLVRAMSYQTYRFLGPLLLPEINLD